MFRHQWGLMRLHLILPGVILPVLLALAGCQSLPGFQRAGTVPAAAKSSPIIAGEITVTSLDAVAPQEAMAAEAEAVPNAPPDAAPAAPGDAAAAGVAEPAAPVTAKSTAHLACEDRGGVWSVAGGGTAAFCQTPTRDNGKSCRAASDCTGYCLSQSGTCAPVTPMLGCHDILDDQGRMLTQCIN